MNHLGIPYFQNVSNLWDLMYNCTCTQCVLDMYTLYTYTACTHIQYFSGYTDTWRYYLSFSENFLNKHWNFLEMENHLLSSADLCFKKYLFHAFQLFLNLNHKLSPTVSIALRLVFLRFACCTTHPFFHCTIFNSEKYWQYHLFLCQQMQRQRDWFFGGMIFPIG